MPPPRAAVPKIVGYFTKMPFRKVLDDRLALALEQCPPQSDEEALFCAFVGKGFDEDEPGVWRTCSDTIIGRLLEKRPDLFKAILYAVSGVHGNMTLLPKLKLRLTELWMKDPCMHSAEKWDILKQVQKFFTQKDHTRF